MDPCEDQELLEPKSYRLEDHNRCRMGIFLKAVDICRNAENELQHRAEGNQYRNIVNRGNSRRVQTVVSRKSETQPSGQPMLTALH